MTYQSFLTKTSKHLSKTSKYLSFTLLISTLSFGAIIYDSGVTALKATDPTQLGRLSRSTVGSGVPSDWSAPKAFPGVANPTVSYRYETFAIPVSPFPYLQISFDDIFDTADTFASAYLNSYNPNSTAANRGLDVNYLGDAGNSGNIFGNPRVFQVVLPSATDHLVIVANDVFGTTSAIGQNFRILVEGFYDTSFNDTIPPAPVPEPATMALSGAGLAIATIAVYRRKSKQ